MVKKVPVADLRVGSFIEKIDISWFKTPFLSNQFKITSNEQIDKLKELKVPEVYINTQKGLDILEAGAVEEKPEKQESPTTQYIPIASAKLLANTELPFDLYLKKGNEYSIYLAEGLPFHSEVKYDLDDQGINTLYITSTDKDHLDQYEKSLEKERELSQKGLAPGFETQEKVEQYNDFLDNYMPVDLTIFFPGLKVPIKLFTEKDSVVTMVLDSGGEVPENEIFCESSNGHKPANLLIQLTDSAKYQDFIKGLSTGKHLGYSEKAMKIRSAVLKENSKLVTRDLMLNPRSGEKMAEAKTVVTGMIDNILTCPNSFMGLMKINTYDYYTYVHSINVCTLSIGLAMEIGLNKKEMSDLAIGAMMHDVGKSDVPSSLINKPGKLTEQEFITVKNHVNLGHKLMVKQTGMSEEVSIPLIQHHEKLNGNGYPNRLENGQIHTFGRIASIVDVYDALTTERSYKKAFQPFEAAKFLAQRPEEFDKSFMKSFVLMLGKQSS